MENRSFKIYPYRWIVLIVFMFVVAINQLLWITFASITSRAAEYYWIRLHPVASGCRAAISGRE
jgi:hypothetical protein